MDFNKALDFQVLLNWAIFSMDVDVQYFTFKISYVRIPGLLSINKHFTHNNEQFGSSLIKIKQILSISRRF